jgi:hypothetical protein
MLFVSLYRNMLTTNANIYLPMIPLPSFYKRTYKMNAYKAVHVVLCLKAGGLHKTGMKSTDFYLNNAFFKIMRSQSAFLIINRK